PGWEARIADPLMREDNALAAATDPRLPPPDARALAARLRTIEARRSDRRAAREPAPPAPLLTWRRRRELPRRRSGLSVTLPLRLGLLGTGAMYLHSDHRRAQAEPAAAQREAMLAFVTRDILGQADPYDSRGNRATASGLRAAVDRAA